MKVKVKKRKPLPAGFKKAQFQPGQSGNPKGGRPRTTVYGAIQKMLDRKSPTGKGTRRDDVAEGFVKAMEGGSFVHAKEIIDREEGKVPNRIAGADGENIKLYAGMPLEGEEAP